MQESWSFIIAMVLQTVQLFASIVAIVLICKQPKVKKAVLALWVNGLIFVLSCFPLIVILYYPERLEKTYFAPVIIWLVNFTSGSEHWALAFIYISSALEFDRIILKEEQIRAKTQKYWFWGVLIVYGVALGIACYINHHRAQNGVIEQDTLPILVNISLCTLSTTLQVYSIKRMKAQIRQALGGKEATFKIVLYFILFVGSNLASILFIAALHYNRKNPGNDLGLDFQKWTHLVLDFFSLALDVFIAYLLVQFSKPLRMINNRAFQMQVPIKVMFKASSGLEKFTQAQRSRKSAIEIVQALKDYEEILKQYQAEHTQSLESEGPEEDGWELDLQVLMDLVDTHVASNHLAQLSTQ